MKVLVDRMEEKLSSQVRGYLPRRKESEEVSAKVGSSDPKDQSSRSRAYQSAINDVYAAMPVHHELKNTKNDDYERPLGRGNSHLYREKEVSERSHYG
jgi:hypothetical protein